MNEGFKNLKDQLVNDYYTPNIKAEVTFDTLLTPYITGIVKDGLKKNKHEVDGEIKFITKEMSIDSRRK